MPPGNYHLEIERQSFRKHLQNFTILVNQDIRVDVSLLPGQRTEQVTVEASSEVLQADSVSMSTVVDTQEFEECRWTAAISTN